MPLGDADNVTMNPLKQAHMNKLVMLGRELHQIVESSLEFKNRQELRNQLNVCKHYQDYQLFIIYYY